MVEVQTCNTARKSTAWMYQESTCESSKHLQNSPSEGAIAQSLLSLFAGQRDSSKASTQLLRDPCKSTSRVGKPCSSVFKEAQPRPSRVSLI